MDEKKLTDEEIVKTVENCLNGDYKTKCEGCYYDKSDRYCQDMDRDLLDLIHRLQAENEELQKQVDELKKRESSIIEYVENNVRNSCPKCKERTVKDTAKEIFDRIFEAICVFTTQDQSEEYNKGFLDAVSEVDERLQKLAKDEGVEVE